MPDKRRGALPGAPPQNTYSRSQSVAVQTRELTKAERCELDALIASQPKPVPVRDPNTNEPLTLDSDWKSGRYVSAPAPPSRDGDLCSDQPQRHSADWRRHSADWTWCHTLTSLRLSGRHADARRLGAWWLENDNVPALDTLQAMRQDDIWNNGGRKARIFHSGENRQQPEDRWESFGEGADFLQADGWLIEKTSNGQSRGPKMKKLPKGYFAEFPYSHHDLFGRGRRSQDQAAIYDELAKYVVRKGIPCKAALARELGCSADAINTLERRGMDLVEKLRETDAKLDEVNERLGLILGLNAVHVEAEAILSSADPSE